MLTTQVSKSAQNLQPVFDISLKKLIKDEGYILCAIETKRFDAEGGNFLGKLYEIDIKGKTAEGEKETNLFIKKKIIFNKFDFVSVNDVYANEEFFYNDLSGVFKYLQDQANIPIEERYRTVKSYAGTNSDAIILDNLAKKNFKTYDRGDVISLKYAKLAFKELAKFHGLSFVLENKMPEYFNKKIKTLKNMYHLNDDWRGLIHNECKYIANMYKDNEVVKQKIENYMFVILDKFPKYNSDNINVKCALSHGDYRMNNVLVREQDGIPVEVVPIDYQTIDYGCPVRDLLFFIFNGSDQEFRRKNLNNLKDLYFESLSKFLKYFDMDVETVYPRRNFEKVYSEWLDYGLMIAIFGIAFIFAPKSGVDFQEIKLSDMPLNFDERSQKLIREKIEDFIEWGYL